MSTQTTPEYMLLFREAPDWDRDLSPEEMQQVMDQWIAWFNRLVEQGKAKAGQPLKHEGKIVSGKKGLVTDGPFAESKEAIAGYILLRVKSQDEAVAIAKDCPGLEYGTTVEVRPIAELHLSTEGAQQPLVEEGTSRMLDHKIVSAEEWVVRRKEFLKKEKEFTRLRDRLSAERRELPWVKVEKNYLFDGPDGKVTLADLFDGRSQLIIYHFMFDPEWSEGCKSCSFFADQYNPAIIHLRQRDVSMVTVSRAPLEKLLSFKKRMGWTFKWVSSFENDFNRDFYVTFTAEELASNTANYNYDFKPFPVTEAPGISVFFKDDEGSIFHTYSSYARGLDIFLTTYNLLDTVPKGRDEEALPYTMEWIRHRDRYGDDTFVDPYVKLLSGGSGKP